MARYSVSKIKTYDSCKLKYNLHYIKNIWPEDELVTDDVVFGKLIHKAFEIYDPVKDNKKEVVKLHRKFPPLSNEYKNLLPKAYKGVFSFFDKYGKYPAENEIKIEYSMEGYDITGYVDRFIHTDKSHICVDYKTSKFASLDYHIFQLKFYNLALSKIYNIPPDKIKMMLFFPRPNESKKMIYSKKQIAQFEKELNRKISGIETNKTWSASPGYHCKWCLFYKTKLCQATFQGENSVIT